MSDEDYKRGYQDGFRDGMQFNVSPTYTQRPLQSFSTNCSVCGMRFDPNKIYGYVCPHYECPTKITSVTNRG